MSCRHSESNHLYKCSETYIILPVRPMTERSLASHAKSHEIAKICQTQIRENGGYFYLESKLLNGQRILMSIFKGSFMTTNK